MTKLHSDVSELMYLDHKLGSELHTPWNYNKNKLSKYVSRRSKPFTFHDTVTVTFIITFHCYKTSCVAPSQPFWTDRARHIFHTVSNTSRKGVIMFTTFSFA
jgi:hypothetical protein